MSRYSAQPRFIQRGPDPTIANWQRRHNRADNGARFLLAYEGTRSPRAFVIPFMFGVVLLCAAVVFSAIEGSPRSGDQPSTVRVDGRAGAGASHE